MLWATFRAFPQFYAGQIDCDVGRIDSGRNSPTAELPDTEGSDLFLAL